MEWIACERLGASNGNVLVAGRAEQSQRADRDLRRRGTSVANNTAYDVLSRDDFRRIVVAIDYHRVCIRADDPSEEFAPINSVGNQVAALEMGAQSPNKEVILAGNLGPAGIGLGDHRFDE